MVAAAARRTGCAAGRMAFVSNGAEARRSLVDCIVGSDQVLIGILNKVIVEGK